MVAISDDDPLLRRACDRCHAIKERCDWFDHNRCARCTRLGHTCVNDRPSGRPGRKPKRSQPSQSTGAPVKSRIDRRTQTVLVRRRRGHDIEIAVPKSLRMPGDEWMGNRQSVQHLLLQHNVLIRFSVSASLCDTTRHNIIPQMVLGGSTLHDGLLACALSWTVDDKDNPGRLTSCYRHASSAMATLSSLQVADMRSVADCLLLGSLIATFAVSLRPNDVLPICRRTLSMIAPLYSDRSQPPSPNVLVFLSCMIMWEVVACLFDCSVPSLRFRPPSETYVDRHVGLCATLLPLFYDVCVVSYEIANGGEGHSQQALDTLETSLQEWHPVVPDGFTTDYPALDVSHMLCQAQVLRVACLLVVHRLRYPFGVNDAPAQAFAMSILSLLELTQGVTGEHVRCVTMPLLVACLELKGVEREKWDHKIVEYAGYSDSVGQHVRNVLNSLWATLDTAEVLTWRGLTAAAAPFLRP